MLVNPTRQNCSSESNERQCYGSEFERDLCFRAENMLNNGPGIVPSLGIVMILTTPSLETQPLTANHRSLAFDISNARRCRALHLRLCSYPLQATTISLTSPPDEKNVPWLLPVFFSLISYPAFWQILPAFSRQDAQFGPVQVTICTTFPSL